MTKEFPPGLRAGTRVQFELYEDDRGIGACKVKAEDGSLIEFNSVRSDYENKVFSGVVEKFRLNGYIFIKPDADLKEYGVWGADIHADCESINTEQRPARVVEKSKVTFKLMRDRNGFHATEINDENGDPIVVAEEDMEDDKHPHERRIFPETFSGEVQTFSWAKGSGWIKPTDLSNELQVKTTHREGFIYFYRRDLVSQDKVFGVHDNVKVKFKCYIDEKGIGACEITDHNGEPLKDQKRPTERENVQHGVVNYYDRNKRECHIRYKGKIHKVPKKQILVLREAEYLLRRGQRVEFLVERWRGRSFLKQVSFPGRRAKPKERDLPQKQNGPNGNYQTSYPNQPLFNPYQPPNGYMPQPHFQQNPFFAEFFNDQHGRQNQGFQQYAGGIPPNYPAHQQYRSGGSYV